jgi:hypothetical protein
MALEPNVSRRPIYLRPTHAVKSPAGRPIPNLRENSAGVRIVHGRPDEQVMVGIATSGLTGGLPQGRVLISTAIGLLGMAVVFYPSVDFPGSHQRNFSLAEVGVSPTGKLVTELIFPWTFLRESNILQIAVNIEAKNPLCNLFYGFTAKFLLNCYPEVLDRISGGQYLTMLGASGRYGSGGSFVLRNPWEQSTGREQQGWRNWSPQFGLLFFLYS